MDLSVLGKKLKINNDLSLMLCLFCLVYHLAILFNKPPVHFTRTASNIQLPTQYKPLVHLILKCIHKTAFFSSAVHNAGIPFHFTSYTVIRFIIQ